MRRRRSRNLQVVAGLALVLLLAAAVAAVAHRDRYSNWPWQGPPERLAWCDRVYERGEREVPRGELDGVDLVAVLRAPPLIGDEGYVPRDARDDARRGSHCPSGFYLRTEDNRYRPYSLVGGV